MLSANFFHQACSALKTPFYWNDYPVSGSVGKGSIYTGNLSLKWNQDNSVSSLYFNFSIFWCLDYKNRFQYAFYINWIFYPLWVKISADYILALTLHANCLQETIFMKCQSPFSRKNKKNTNNLSSAEFVQRVIKVYDIFHIHGNT